MVGVICTPTPFTTSRACFLSPKLRAQSYFLHALCRAGLSTQEDTKPRGGPSRLQEVGQAWGWQVSDQELQRGNLAACPALTSGFR